MIYFYVRPKVCIIKHVPLKPRGGADDQIKEGIVAIVSMKALLEAGVHFGHRTRRWNPKMKPHIFTERNGIHIIDLQQTIAFLEEAYNVVRDMTSEGGIILFAGTKKQAQENVALEAQRCGMPYVTQRWLGGTLTNFRTIRQRVDYMLELEARSERGEFSRLPKKEAQKLERKIAKLNRRMGGLREMRQLPGAIFIADTRREALAVKEAGGLNIPIIAMVDTNCDPDPIDYIIPANDDAIRAIKLITSKIADAVLEGRQIRAVVEAEEEEEIEPDSKYLGPSIMAKLERGELAAEEHEEEYDAYEEEEGEEEYVAPKAIRKEKEEEFEEEDYEEAEEEEDSEDYDENEDVVED
jgi:small subunit ribosomal protein S2